jgi:hypothetical protein
MSFAPVQDLLDGQVSPQERLRSQMQMILKRRKNVSPNKADGFLTTSTHADSDAEGDGGISAAPGGTPGQN